MDVSPGKKNALDLIVAALIMALTACASVAERESGSPSESAAAQMDTDNPAVFLPGVPNGGEFTVVDEKDLNLRPSKKFPSCHDVDFETVDAPENRNDYDYSDYADAMLAKVRGNWKIPVVARMGHKGVVSVRFAILEDGSIGCMDFVARSSWIHMDTAAWFAVSDSEFFDPLPPTPSAGVGEFVTIHFYYNTEVPPNGTVTWEGRVLRPK